jgi:transcription antitermination factor NusG
MTDKDQRISDIIDKLDSLMLEANDLTRELKEQRKQEGKKSKRDESSTYAHGFQKGDKVIITNVYRGRRGTIGIVTHTTKVQVTLLDESGTTHTRKFTNVSKIG